VDVPLYLEVLSFSRIPGEGIGKELLLLSHGWHTSAVREDGMVGFGLDEPAIQFYKKLGAKPMDEWTVYRP
jgi:hypothetical protein